MQGVTLRPQVTGCRATSSNYTVPKNKTASWAGIITRESMETSLFKRIVTLPICKEQHDIFVDVNQPVLHQLESHAHNLHPNDDINGEEEEEVRVF